VKPALRALFSSRLRQRIALAMAMAIAFAGIAQASHHHKDELARGTTDVQCLLCLFAAGSAPGPPAIVQAVVPSARSYHFPTSILVPQSSDAASYDARGPPVV
jgi:hypothetical protein